MLKIIILSLLVYSVLFTGCVNKRGISAKYYNDCTEYYDSKGYYHKDCDENMLEFKDVKKVFEPQEEQTDEPKGSVW